MAVYYKFKSAKDYDTVAIEGHFISVANLKDKIFETKHLGRGTDFDLVISNAQTNEEYLDEATLVPKNTSVLVRRVPGRPRMPITTEKREEKVTEIQNEQITSSKNGFQANDYNKYPDESEWDEFGTDLYAIPEVPVPLGIPVISQPDMTSKADEDSKIKAFVDSSASDWQRQTQEFSGGRGYGRGGGRGFGGRGFGRVLERKTPPQGYVCHRCKIPGHFIQHCPTNGDPNYDIKKVKPPTGIPKSMLVATPDGSYALPSGAVACLKPNEAAFEKEVEGLPSNRSVAELPPELRCPLCKDVMKDAVLTSKCCFKSYCDKCIRDYIISKSMCVCGKTRVLADDLLPNKTLRETIDRILEHNNTSSQDNAGSFMHVQDMESAKFARPKAPSPSFSGCIRDSNRASSKSDFLEIKENGATEKASGNHTQQSTEKNPGLKAPEPFVNAIDSASTKEPVSQESAPVMEEEVQQKIPVGDLAKKKKKKRIRQPSTNNDMQWRVNQDFGAEGCLMPYSAAAYNPYWSVPQWGPEGYMNPAAMPFMPYGPGGCVMPPEMYGAQGYMPGFMPPVNRDYMDYSMSAQNSGNKVMSREEFEARKADLKRKRENDQRHSGRDYSKNEYDGEADMGHSRARMRMQSQVLPHGTHRREERGMSTDRQREPEHLSSSPKSQGKRKSDKEGSYGRDGRNHTDVKLDSQLMVESEVNKTSKLGVSDKSEKKPKGSVFSRISFPGKRDDDFHAGPAKKKTMNSLEPQNGFREQEVSRHTNNVKLHYDDTKSTKRIPNGRRINHEEDFSDNEQNFKRKAPVHRHDRNNDRDGEKHSDVGSRSSKHVRERIH